MQHAADSALLEAPVQLQNLCRNIISLAKHKFLCAMKVRLVVVQRSNKIQSVSSSNDRASNVQESSNSWHKTWRDVNEWWLIGVLDR